MKRLVLCTAFGLLISVANARDYGQWEGTDPEIREWYQHLMQPDNPAVSCCGEADAYWADSFEVDGDKYVAITSTATWRREESEMGGFWFDDYPSPEVIKLRKAWRSHYIAKGCNPTK